MGPVNMMALDEYKETAERHGFLMTQRQDLIESIENTQETIKEIDQISRTKFDEALGHQRELRESFCAAVPGRPGIPARERRGETRKRAGWTLWFRRRARSCRMCCCSRAAKSR
jgi:hypothetical protein